jgi:GntR family transcriptional regulator
MHSARVPSDPLYLQVKDTLAEEIRSGVYQAHQRVPSERELSEKFSISRMTARQALIELGRDGLVYTRIGKGTFVTEARIDQPLQGLSSFSEDMAGRGARSSSRVVECEIVDATPAAAVALRIPPGSLTVRLTRVRLADGAPLAVETAYLPAGLVPGLLQHNFATESLYQVLESDYGLQLARAEQRIEASLAGARELALLELTPPAPVLRMQRLTLTTDGIPVEWALSSYRGDRYSVRSILIASNIGGHR